MKKNDLKKLAVLVLALSLILSLSACALFGAGTETREEANTVQNAGSNEARTPAQNAGSGSSAGENSSGESSTGGSSAMDASELFSDRDLQQEADLSEAVSYTVSDGSDLSISAAGVYVLSGSAKNVTVCIEAGDEDKVQLVLDGLSVTNDDFPVIYVKNADKVFVTSAEGSENTLSVTGAFLADGSVNTDGVIFSRDDLVFNGLGTLNIGSTDNGISGKDDVKITGGTLNVYAVDHGIEANDSIAVCGGLINVKSTAKDGLHAENEDDDTEGRICISGGTLNVNAADDGIHAVSIVQIDGGAITVQAAEGVEATWVQINDGELTISASDDGINAGRKSASYTPCVEINGGVITITMGQGDTDGVDSNGDLIITGGTISVTGQSAFDWDSTVTWTGGTITVNGSEISEITSQFGGGMGGHGGQGGFPGGQGGGQGGHGGQGGFGGGRRP